MSDTKITEILGPARAQSTRSGAAQGTHISLRKLPFTC